MSETKHTPGPWALEVDPDGMTIGPWSGKREHPHDGGGPVVDSRIVYIDRKDRVSLEDATLMAAAPDLLAALEAARDALLAQDASYATRLDERGLRALAAVEAAIAKAKGERAS